MSPVVVLVGPPGAGKSTVGALLAAALGVELRDTDAAVEASAGMSVADIFVDEGEPRFRELERAAVVAGLAHHDGVLALGGGSITDPATRAALQDSYVVFLDVTLGEGVRRVGIDGARPLLLDSPRQVLRRLMDQRRPLYDEVATAHVDTTGRMPEEIAAELVDLVRTRP